MTYVERVEDEMWRWAAAVHGAVEELSDLHALRATGYLILSVEALVVTWYWPKIFPPRSSRKSSRRRRRSFDGFQEESSRKSEGWYGYGAGGEGQAYSGPSSTYSGGRPPTIVRGGRRDSWEGDSRKERSLSTGEELLAGRLEALAERQASFASAGLFAAATDTPRSSEAGDFMPARNGARRYVRPLVLSALAGFAAYLLVYLLLAGDTAAILAPSGSPMVTLSTPGMDGARALREKAVALQKAATAVAERQEKADRDRAEMAERERKETAEQQRIATEKQAERERIEKAERAREEKAEQAQKEKVEQVRKEKAEREASERAQRERALEERQKRQLAKAASAKENAEAATKARAAQQRDEQALGVLFSLQTELRASRMATLSQDDPSLVLGQTLSRGSTELKITEKGDLALVTGNKSKWVARGSKKRRNLITWLWRKLRRRQTILTCTECRLQVTPSGRLELREKKKLLWSDGEPTRRRRKKQPAGDVVGKIPGGPYVYRLVVTADGNAELRRGGAEDVVVWQALPAP